jgi:hypothetical protein
MTPRAYLVPATRSYVAGYPPPVESTRVYKVLPVPNKVVSEAVLATNVAVVPSKVYRPSLIREAPTVAVAEDTKEISSIVKSQRGVKKVK